MSAVLDYFREKEPKFKEVPDETLAEYIGDTYPEFLQQPEFEKQYAGIKLFTPRPAAPAPSATEPVAHGDEDAMTVTPPTPAPTIPTTDDVDQTPERAMVRQQVAREQIAGPSPLRRFTESQAGELAGRTVKVLTQPTTAIQEFGISTAEKLGLAKPGELKPQPIGLGITVQDIKDVLDMPLQAAGLGKIESNFGLGALDAVTGLAQFLSSGDGVATLGIGGMSTGAKKAILAAFSFDLAKESPEQFKRAYQAAVAGDTRMAVYEGLSGLGGAIFAASAAKHATADLVPKPPSITPRTDAVVEGITAKTAEAGVREAVGTETSPVDLFIQGERKPVTPTPAAAPEPAAPAPVLNPQTTAAVREVTKPQAGNWRNLVDNPDIDPYRRSDILRSIADLAKTTPEEQSAVLERITPTTPERGNIAWAVANNRATSVETKKAALRLYEEITKPTERQVIQSEEAQGQERVQVEPTPVAEPTAPAVPAKEPWQMIKTEWADSVRAKYAQSNAELKANGFSGITEPRMDAHANIVRNAIEKGKPVPLEVLAEYPELTKPTEKGAADAVTEKRVEEGVQPERERVEAQRTPNEPSPSDSIQRAATGEETPQGGVNAPLVAGGAPGTVPKGVEHWLKVEIPDATQAKETVKTVLNKRNEIRKEYDDLNTKLKALEPKVMTGSKFRRRVKQSARKSDLQEYRAIQDQMRKLDEQSRTLDETTRGEQNLVEQVSTAKFINDENKPLAARLEYRLRLWYDQNPGKEPPADLVAARDAALTKSLKEAFPDITPEEIKNVWNEASRNSAMGDPLKGSGIGPDTESRLQDLRRAEVDTPANKLNNPSHEFSQELKSELGKFISSQSGGWDRRMSQEKLTRAKVDELKQRIDEETKVIRERHRQAEEASKKAEEENKAKEEQMLAEAQAIVDSKPRGSRSAKEIKTDLIERLGKAISSVIDTAKVKLELREDGDWWATDGDKVARGTIEEAGKGSYKVTAVDLSDNSSRLSVTVGSKEEAQWFIKAMAASTNGRSVVAVPGDGIFTLRNHGPSLLKVWLDARKLDTSGGKASYTTKGGAQSPPMELKTTTDWEQAKQFHGLEPTDKIYGWSTALNKVAEKVNPKKPKSVTAKDVDDFIEAKRKPAAPEEPPKPEPEPPKAEPPAPEPIGMGGAVPSEFEKPGRQTAGKIDAINKARQERGMDPLEKLPSFSDQATLDRAMARMDKDPAYVDNLVAAVLQKHRAAQDASEIAALDVQRVLLEEERDKAAARAAQAYDDYKSDPEKFGGRLEDKELASRDVDVLDKKLSDLEAATQILGSETGRTLRFLRRPINDDLTLGAMETTWRKTHDWEQVPKDVHEELKRMAEEAKASREAFEKRQAEWEKEKRDLDLARSLAEARAAAAEAQRHFFPKEVMEYAEEIAKKWDKIGDDAVARIKAKMGRTTAGVDPTILADATLAATARFIRWGKDKAVWMDKMLVELGDWIKPHLEELWGKAQESTKENLTKDKPKSKSVLTAEDIKAGIEAAVEKIKAKVERNQGDKKAKLAEISADVDKMVDMFIKRNPSIGDRELVDAVHAELQKIVPEVTWLEAADAISHRGIFWTPSEKAFSKIKADLKTRIRLLGHIQETERRMNQAMAERKPLPKTGYIPRKLSDIARRYKAQLDELLRQYPAMETDPAKGLAESIQSRMTYLENRMTDLRHEMKTGKLLLKDKTAAPTSPELAKRQEEYKKVKEEHAKVFAAETQAKKAAAVEASIDRQIADLTAELEAIKRGETPAAKPAQAKITNTAIEAKRERLEALREEKQYYKDLANPKKTPLERALQAQKTRWKHEIADKTERMAKGDFSTKPRRQPLDISKDPEAMGLLAKVEKVRREFKEKAEMDEWAKAKFATKTYGRIKGLAGAYRNIKTSYDLSAVGRQGFFLGLVRPHIAIKAVSPMLKSFAKQKVAEQVEQSILNRPNAKSGLYMRSKLYIAPLDIRNFTAAEEFMQGNMGKLTEKIPGIRASNRAFITYLNLLRADTFDALVDSAQSRGLPLGEGELKAIANYINVATGRGQGKSLDRAAETLAGVLFSPRLLASRFQLLAGQPLYHGTARTRALLAKEYVKIGMGLAAMYGIASFAGTEIGSDPTNSDFGKMIFGNTRVDPLAGLSQIAVLMSRAGTGKITTTKGAEKAMWGEDKKFGSRGLRDLLADFFYSKEAPALGTIINVAGREDVMGRPVTLGSEAQQMVVPLAWGDVLDVMEDEGVPRGLALQVLGLLGMGLQYHDPERTKEPEYWIEKQWETFKRLYPGKEK